jgi:hypothetical protein
MPGILPAETLLRAAVGADMLVREDRLSRNASRLARQDRTKVLGS